MRVIRLFGEWAVLLALSIAGAIFLQSSDLTQRIDNQLLDNVSAFARPAPSDDIEIIAIDDRSLAEIGGWPWPRARHAQLLDRLTDAGARIVVLDILFLEDSTAEDDAALAQALRRNGNVLLPHTFEDRADATEGTDPLYPLPEFQAAARVGHVAAEPDPDGILRRFDLMRATDQGSFPHLAVQALEMLGQPDAAGEHGSSALITFQPDDVPSFYSASAVIDGEYSPEFFKDKIVLIGATAQGMGDRYSVSDDTVRLMTGIETQANLINALITKSVITPIGALWQNAIAVIALLVLFATFWYLSPRWGLYVAIALVGILIATSISMLAIGWLWLPVVPAIIVIALAYPLWSWRRLSHVSRYLDREAARLVRSNEAVEQGRGMEYVARQVDRVRGLIHSVQGSLSYIRQVIEAAPDAMLVVDDDGAVQILNGKADQLFPGWEDHEPLSLTELFAFGRATLQRDATELMTEDGRTFLIARSHLGTPGQDDLSGDILALRDISALRRLDQERKQMLEFLSHDMRTPQVAIIGLTRKQADAPTNCDTMTRIRKQANRTLKLADDFVQLARLESPELQLEDSDIRALIEEACDRAYVLAEAKHIAIEQQLPDDPCFADVDASLIARMMDNLIGNAVKYSPEHSTITVGLSATGEASHKISVSDEGAGLPEARVKDPFARFGAHATDAGPSAGLGLALVKKVVDAHQGTIDVASKKGAGTKFTISLEQ